MSGKFSQSSSVTAQTQLVQWINEAGMSEGGKKAKLLRKIVEVLLHQAPQMIPVYMENILSFVNDKTTDVKRQVVGFIEEISKSHQNLLPKVVGQLQLLVIDSVVAVQKRAIQAASIVYRNVLLWLCKGTSEVSDMQYVWEHLTELKLLILNMIDSDNEGIRTHSIKFLEEVVLLQSSNPDDIEEGFRLENLPAHLPFLNRKAMEEESDHIFRLLLKFHNSQHISSVNLMACMTTLCLVAKLRPRYLPSVVQALGDLHTTLPPTLSQSQVNSVRKHLKMQILILVRHPSSNEMMPQLTQLLSDIGMTPQEINKAIPKERRNKRLGEIKNSDTPAKRFRVDSPQSTFSDSNSNSRSDFNFDDDSSQSTLITKTTATEDSIFDGLNNLDNVINLVMATLLNNLPSDMPSSFLTAYKPIPNAGTKPQKRSLAKMMLSLVKDEQPTQIINPISDLINFSSNKIPLLREDDEKATLKNAVAKLQESTKADKQMENAVSKLMEETRQEHLKEGERKNKDKEKLQPPPTAPKMKPKVKLLKLQELTRPVPKEIKEKLVIQAVDRILRAEKDSAIGGASQIRTKFITIFASSYTHDIRELVLNYILDNPLNRIDLALSWLYEEYAYMQGFNRHPVTLYPKLHEKHDENYNHLFCTLITQIAERGDPIMEGAKDVLLRKIYLECPTVTDEGVDYLKHLISEGKSAILAMDLLEELCIMRPPRAHKYVTALVCHVLSDNEEIRNITLTSTVKIYKSSTEWTKKVIEKHALLYLGFIFLSTPPPEVYGTRTMNRSWTDDLYKICLNLVMAVFVEKEELIMEIARVYGTAGAEAKRSVLRQLEGPLRNTLSNSGNKPSPALMALVDECPRGAETLLTRLVHLLTDKSAPTPWLVSRVRELYATRVSDVRFLIPVLNGLSQKEILAALPKLIKLNPVVVKEVFNKLLGLQNPNNEQLPVSPEELLVALHLIDPSKADLKYIIKATALCFAEKQTFTENVLSAVLQRLAEETEIPVLMMRTVLQALTLYPTLGSLVLNILQLLIEREVWNNKVAWEGWLKCSERLGGRATPVLAALPLRAKQLLPPHLAGLLPQESYTVNPLEPLPPGMET